MTEEIFTTEALILKSIDFRDFSKIVTLYSKKEGLIKLFVKFSKRTPLTLRSLMTPLTKAELQLSKSKSEFFHFHDGTLLDQRLALRKNLQQMQTAITCVTAFCKTQWPGQANEALYHLLDLFLIEITKRDKPKQLLPIFYLKLLKHEGILQRSAHCAECNQQLQESYRYKGECYCAKDAPPPALFFSATEELLLQTILEGRNFDTLYALAPQEDMTKKVFALFEQNFI